MQQPTSLRFNAEVLIYCCPVTSKRCCKVIWLAFETNVLSFEVTFPPWKRGNGFLHPPLTKQVYVCMCDCVFRIPKMVRVRRNWTKWASTSSLDMEKAYNVTVVLWHCRWRIKKIPLHLELKHFSFWKPVKTVTKNDSIVGCIYQRHNQPLATPILIVQ